MFPSRHLHCASLVAGLVCACPQHEKGWGERDFTTICDKHCCYMLQSWLDWEQTWHRVLWQERQTWARFNTWFREWCLNSHITQFTQLDWEACRPERRRLVLPVTIPSISLVHWLVCCWAQAVQYGLDIESDRQRLHWHCNGKALSTSRTVTC